MPPLRGPSTTLSTCGHPCGVRPSSVAPGLATLPTFFGCGVRGDGSACGPLLLASWAVMVLLEPPPYWLRRMGYRAVPLAMGRNANRPNGAHGAAPPPPSSTLLESGDAGRCTSLATAWDACATRLVVREDVVSVDVWLAVPIRLPPAGHGQAATFVRDPRCRVAGREEYPGGVYRGTASARRCRQFHEGSPVLSFCSTVLHVVGRHRRLARVVNNTILKIADVWR